MAFPNESLPRAWQGKKIDFVLLAYFALWYLGNYYYNITNKRALTAAGGVHGFPMTIATLQARSKRHIFGEQNKWIDGIQLDPQTFEWFHGINIWWWGS
ncbi:unnamed protein product [Cladocopium goreaui]|uniref:Sugar phosphate transporter domain-containing protein n=1 Tax=Cladocopium goreaui TaxID=2562237 RepID=A0A9P1M2Z4_9DINO|nr:unnamed protein product [Cladocopium goreaui]